MSVTTGSPPLVTPTNVSLLDSTLHLAALGHHPHPRYEWNPFLEAGGLSDYVQYSSSNNPTQIHMPQPQHYIPVHLTTGIPHTMYSPYPGMSLQTYSTIKLLSIQQSFNFKYPQYHGILIMTH